MAERTTYRELIEKIERRRDLPNRVESFARFQRALSRLNLQTPERGTFLIAGTNGKGTVAKTLETLLKAGGESVGLYTSPHLMAATERIRSHGRDLTPEEFVQAYELIAPVALDNDLSHFEILTLMMAEVFFGGRVREPVQRAVLEVGLGGRLDPTRAFPHQICLVTSLGLDHVELLGRDLISIAREKFAIVAPGNLVLHGSLPPEVRVVAAEVQARVPGRWIEVAPARYSVAEAPDYASEPRWTLHTRWGDAPLAMLGERGATNTALALEALAALDLPMPLRALQEVRWPCRMERFEVRGKRVYLSGDHNTEGVRTIREILKNFRYRRLHLIVGIGRNKDHAQMLTEFLELPRVELSLTTSPVKPARLADYGDWLARAVDTGDDSWAVLNRAIDRASFEDLVLVSGSLYLVGDLRKALLDQ